MGPNEYTIFKIIGFIILFGPPAVAGLAWGRAWPYVISLFLIAYALGYIFVVFLGIWVLIFFLPAAWYFALKPFIDKITYP